MRLLQHKSSLPVVTQRPYGRATTICLIGSVVPEDASQTQENAKPLAKFARAPVPAGATVPYAHRTQVATTDFRQRGGVGAQTSSRYSQSSSSNAAALNLICNRSNSQQNEKIADTGGCNSLLH